MRIFLCLSVFLFLLTSCSDFHDESNSNFDEEISLRNPCLPAVDGYNMHPESTLCDFKEESKNLIFDTFQDYINSKKGVGGFSNGLIEDNFANCYSTTLTYFQAGGGNRFYFCDDETENSLDCDVLISELCPNLTALYFDSCEAREMVQFFIDKMIEESHCNEGETPFLIDLIDFEFVPNTQLPEHGPCGFVFNEERGCVFPYLNGASIYPNFFKVTFTYCCSG